MKYDYLIVGSGLFGSVFAHENSGYFDYFDADGFAEF